MMVPVMILGNGELLWIRKSRGGDEHGVTNQLEKKIPSFVVVI